MRLLLLGVLFLAGCTTTTEPAPAMMPTCVSEAECGAKLTAAREWLAARHFKTRDSKEFAIDAYAMPYAIQIRQTPMDLGWRLDTKVICLAASFDAACAHGIYDQLINITAAMNESASPVASPSR